MTGLESLVGKISIEDLIESNLSHVVSVLKKCLSSYYFSEHGESLWDCRFDFEASNIDLFYTERFLLSMCSSDCNNLRDIIVGFFGQNSGELVIYDCYRDLYETRSEWCKGELSEMPGVSLIRAMSWEEEFL